MVQAALVLNITSVVNDFSMGYVWSSIGLRSNSKLSHSQAQAPTTTKIAVDIVATIFGSTFSSLLGGCLASRYRNTKPQSENGDIWQSRQSVYDHRHHDQRERRRSNSPDQRYKETQIPRAYQSTHLPQYREDPAYKQLQPFSTVDKKFPTAEVSLQNRRRL